MQKTEVAKTLSEPRSRSENPAGSNVFVTAPIIAAVVALVLLGLHYLTAGGGVPDRIDVAQKAVARAEQAHREAVRAEAEAAEKVRALEERLRQLHPVASASPRPPPSGDEASREKSRPRGDEVRKDTSHGPEVRAPGTERTGRLRAAKGHLDLETQVLLLEAIVVLCSVALLCAVAFIWKQRWRNKREKNRLLELLGKSQSDLKEGLKRLHGGYTPPADDSSDLRRPLLSEEGGGQGLRLPSASLAPPVTNDNVAMLSGGVARGGSAAPPELPPPWGSSPSSSQAAPAATRITTASWGGGAQSSEAQGLPPNWGVTRGSAPAQGPPLGTVTLPPRSERLIL